MTLKQINPLQMHRRPPFELFLYLKAVLSVMKELNNRLAAEITKMRSMASEDGGDAGGVMQGKELYELEVCCFPFYLGLFPQHLLGMKTSSSCLCLQVMLRVKESEVQYLKQEINSLKDELQTAQRVSAASSPVLAFVYIDAFSRRLYPK